MRKRESDMFRKEQRDTKKRSGDLLVFVKVNAILCLEYLNLLFLEIFIHLLISLHGGTKQRGTRVMPVYTPVVYAYGKIGPQK